MDFTSLKLIKTSYFEKIFDLLKNNDHVLIENLPSASKFFLLKNLFEQEKKSLLFISTEEQISNFSSDFFTFFNTYPDEFPSSGRDVSEKVIEIDALGERYKILNSLKEAQKEIFCFSTLKAILEKVPCKEDLDKIFIRLKLNDLINFSIFIKELQNLGYKQVSLTTEKGEFSIRGGIIDIFPISSLEPYRIEFWDNKILSIRPYNPTTQLSTSKIEKLTISPIKSYFQNIKFSSIFSYLPKNTLIIFDEIFELENNFSLISSVLKTFPHIFSSIGTILEESKAFSTLYFSSDPLKEQHIKHETSDTISFEVFLETLVVHRTPSIFTSLPSILGCSTLNDFKETLKNIFLKIKDYLTINSNNPLKIMFFFNKKNELKIFNEVLDIVFEDEACYECLKENKIFSSSFYSPQLNLIVLSSCELFDEKTLRRQKQRIHYKTSLHNENFSLPNQGDNVVHINNGIGKFLRIETKPNHLNQQTEYMVLEYSDNAILYVPLQQSHLVSKYIGTNTAEPELDKLQGKKWKRICQQTELSLLNYASDLLKTQAKRALIKGVTYPKKSEEVLNFYESFPYEETPDQKQAIEDVDKDMESDQVMDRLICGDTGFGKTEVAMRAALRTVLDGGKQVAVMVPTTVLAVQHYETFKNRMAGFPVTIASISRFSKTKDVKKIIEQLFLGEIDILIGTHRLISKDCIFNDLGLLIIDEEQRFGVKVKEYLKHFFPKVNCLTLSATPIPRTLYLSLSGARDISVISTPPCDRLPIETIVCRKDDTVLKQAICHELFRNGQVYFIHNRIETLFAVAKEIKDLIPIAKIAVVHGQMSSKEIESAFEKFKTKEANILVSTSLIENGIDIPNANTILIDNSDKIGLADLYQMRGRVGRWNRKAYCYFLFSSSYTLNSIAAKRLSVLSSSEGSLGGMSIALHDLEIRGAGNILGTHQTGHVSSIGFNLYCRLLKKTMKALEKNETPLFLYDDVKLEFPFSAKIPDFYISDTNLRMEFYQRLGDTEEGDIPHIEKELIDRFGPFPEEVSWLLELSKLRVFCLFNNFITIQSKINFICIEQIHGKENKICKKIPWTCPSTPKELIPSIKEILQKNFTIKKLSTIIR